MTYYPEEAIMTIAFVVSYYQPERFFRAINMGERQMKVLDELERFQEAALNNKSLRNQILKTKKEEEPFTAFCRLAREKGYEIYEMDLLYVGEEAYAGMRRATNGGGENSPMLEYEDDYYKLFMAAIEERK